MAWRLERGATVERDGVGFAVWAPRAERLDVVLRDGRAVQALDRDAGGVFSGFVRGARAGDDYRYRLHGDRGPRDRPDPVSRWQPIGVHGPSRVVDPALHRWTDAAWRGPALADLVLYELHVGTFTPAGTFDGAIARMPYLVDLGVTAIEIMPVAEFPGARNWGYDGVHLYAPQSTYGGPEGLRRLVDAAHAAGLAVVLDVVYNHLGPEGNVLAEYGPYFTDRYRTAWGMALNVDGPDSDEVRRWIVDDARYWVAEFHVDGLRLDAAHAIVDASAHHLLGEIASAVHALGETLGRRVHVIAESDLNDPRLVRPSAAGGYGLDAQWSDDFHHAVHALLTSERDGYYADFGGVAPLAKALRDRFVYDGNRSAFRRRRHGASATDVPAERFVVCVQNHDQVGNRAHGDRLSTLVPAAKQRVAAALLLFSPYLPLLFMGEEYGETNPFLYFVSHGDPALAEAVWNGRREEFATFAWQGDVPDPNAFETFARSQLDWAKLDQPEHRALFALHHDCLVLRRTEPALRPGAAVDVAADDAGWCVLTLRARDAPDIAAVFNLGEGRAIPFAGATFDTVLSTEDARYGGTGNAVVRAVDRLHVPAWSATCLRRRP